MNTVNGLIAILQTKQDELMKKYLNLYKLSPSDDCVKKITLEVVAMSVATIETANSEGVDNMHQLIIGVQYCTIMIGYHFKEVTGFTI